MGKAAITGWRDVIAPSLRGPKNPRAQLRLWPFDGRLEDLLEQPGMVVAETYPGEIYGHFPMEIAAPGRSKRRQGDRFREAPLLIGAASDLAIDLADSLRALIEDGFGKEAVGEDRFDAAAVGLFRHDQHTARLPHAGMIRATRFSMPSEGWILGAGGFTGRALTLSEVLRRRRRHSPRSCSIRFGSGAFCGSAS